MIIIFFSQEDLIKMQQKCIDDDFRPIISKIVKTLMNWSTIFEELKKFEQELLNNNTLEMKLKKRKRKNTVKDGASSQSRKDDGTSSRKVDRPRFLK